jgi:hypothetical protein
MKKFIITEEEKKRILGLYEQTAVYNTNRSGDPFEYKKENGKVYFKGKTGGKFTEKYPNWTQAKNQAAIDAINTITDWSSTYDEKVVDNTTTTTTTIKVPSEGGDSAIFLSKFITWFKSPNGGNTNADMSEITKVPNSTIYLTSDNSISIPTGKCVKANYYVFDKSYPDRIYTDNGYSYLVKIENGKMFGTKFDYDYSGLLYDNNGKELTAPVTPTEGDCEQPLELKSKTETPTGGNVKKTYENQLISAFIDEKKYGDEYKDPTIKDQFFSDYETQYREWLSEKGLLDPTGDVKLEDLTKIYNFLTNLQKR